MCRLSLTFTVVMQDDLVDASDFLGFNLVVLVHELDALCDVFD